MVIINIIIIILSTTLTDDCRFIPSLALHDRNELSACNTCAAHEVVQSEDANYGQIDRQTESPVARIARRRFHLPLLLRLTTERAGPVEATPYVQPGEINSAICYCSSLGVLQTWYRRITWILLTLLEETVSADGWWYRVWYWRCCWPGFFWWFGKCAPMGTPLTHVIRQARHLKWRIDRHCGLWTLGTYWFRLIDYFI